MALRGKWGAMYASPEYALKSAAQRQSAKASDFQQKIAGEQWDMQKNMYANQQEAGRQGAEGLGALIGSYNSSNAAARAANEKRYGEIVGIADNTQDQRSADISSDYNRREASGLQSLARSGLSGTSRANTLGLGVEREKQSALNRSRQDSAAQRIGVRERREDEYPDSNMIMQLVQSLSQGSGGAGAGAIAKALGKMRFGGDPGAPGGGGLERAI